MLENKKTFIFDLDNTLCTPVEKGQYQNAKPWLLRIAYVNSLYFQGHKVIIYTARCGSKNWFKRYIINYFMTKRQLKLWGCRYSKLKVGKLHYDHWIDDKAENADKFFGVLNG